MLRENNLGIIFGGEMLPSFSLFPTGKASSMGINWPCLWLLISSHTNGAAQDRHLPVRCFILVWESKSHPEVLAAESKEAAEELWMATGLSFWWKSFDNICSMEFQNCYEPVAVFMFPIHHFEVKWAFIVFILFRFCPCIPSYWTQWICFLVSNSLKKNLILL